MTFLKLKTIPINCLFLEFKNFFHPVNKKQLNWTVAPMVRGNWGMFSVKTQLQRAGCSGFGGRSRSGESLPGFERLGLSFADLEKENTSIF
ncbi:MAG: hypothetical protein D6680_03095 [Cyanobacteria bacterium J007]|nr:MAG: hypothetical protein D6680_03095 [Cyanobacteria bacterium J007]